MAPPNLIEPPQAVKLISAFPVKSKKMLERKQAAGRGKMKPIRAGPEPKGLGIVHGVVGLPSVGAYGDIEGAG